MAEERKPGMNADEFRKAAHAAIEEIIAYNENITNYPVLPQIKPGYLAPQLPTSAPETSEPWTQIQPDISDKIVPGLTHWQSPNFMAYFPAGSTYPGILGEMYSAAFTAPAFNWLCSPACTELETIVLDWLCRALSLPEAYLSTSSTGGGGVIQGSASEAVVTCMVAARERYLHARCDSEGLPNPSPERDARIAQLRPNLVALSSDQAHSSTAKGALIAGTQYQSIKTSLSNNLALTGPDLASTLDALRSSNLEPYYLTLTIGTTSTCSVDDFTSLAPILKSHPNIWVHIDAAYAGAALLLPTYATSLSPLTALADSFNMNMHKWLLVNFDASALFVQNRNHLTRALSISAPYYQNQHSDSGLVTDYRDWQIPLGRRFRALKMWFVMRSYGLKGMREHIEYTIGLGEIFAVLVRGRGDLFEIVGEPQFALTCFRVRAEVFTHAANGISAAVNGSAAGGVVDPAFEPVSAADDQAEVDANVVTKEVVDAVNADGEIHIIGSNVKGKNIIRVVSANPRAEEKYVRGAFEVIVGITEEIVRKKGGNVALINGK